MDNFETVPLEKLDDVSGGFLQFLGLLGAVAPLVGKIVDATRKNGGDGKATQIGDSAGQLFSGIANMGGGGQTQQPQQTEQTQDA